MNNQRFNLRYSHSLYFCNKATVTLSLLILLWNKYTITYLKISKDIPSL